MAYFKAYSKVLCSSVSVETKATRWTTRFRFPAVAGIFLSSPTRPDRVQDSPSLLSNGYRGSNHGGKAAEAWSWPLTTI